MNGILVDTDVISFAIKEDTRADAYKNVLTGFVPFVSFMTLAELHSWSLRSKWGAARVRKFESALDAYIRLSATIEMEKLWAEVTIAVEKSGHHIECADAWNAAVALYYNLPLITHNRKDYEHVPSLRLVSMNKP